MDISAISEIIVQTSQLTVSGQINGMMTRIYEVVASVSAILIAILWIPIAIGFFSTDENRRYEARLRLRNALIGTFIYVLAVSGFLYALVNYLVTG